MSLYRASEILASRLHLDQLRAASIVIEILAATGTPAEIAADLQRSMGVFLSSDAVAAVLNEVEPADAIDDDETVAD